MEGGGQLDRKIAVVTGAAGSIGAAVVKALAAGGYSVGLIDLQEEQIKAISGCLEGKAIAFPADLSTPESCANVACKKMLIVFAEDLRENSVICRN